MSNVRIMDTATPFLKQAAKENPKWIDRAIKSAGWWMRREVKAGIQEGAPGGQPYKGYSDITKSGMLDAMRGRGKVKSGKRYRAPRRYYLNKEHKPMGKLQQAVEYRFYSDSHRAIVGWISQSAEHRGTMMEKGKKIPITDSMRKFFWAAGFPLSKNKKYINIPARPTIEPEYQENLREVPRYIEGKVWGYYLREGGN